MSAATLPPRTLVIVGRRLGRIVKPASHGAAPGYTVQTATEAHEGSAPHWAPESGVHVAELGRNVCWTPCGGCFCGRLHVSETAIRALQGGTR